MLRAEQKKLREKSVESGLIAPILRKVECQPECCASLWSKTARKHCNSSTHPLWHVSVLLHMPRRPLYMYMYMYVENDSVVRCECVEVHIMFMT